MAAVSHTVVCQEQDNRMDVRNSPGPGASALARFSYGGAPPNIGVHGSRRWRNLAPRQVLCFDDRAPEPPRQPDNASNKTAHKRGPAEASHHIREEERAR